MELKEGEEADVQEVARLDDEAPAGPDHAGSGEGEVLREGELVGGTVEVGDAGEDESPLRKEVSVSI